MDAKRLAMVAGAAGDDAGCNVESDCLRSGGQRRESVRGAPRFENSEIGLVGLPGGGSFCCTDEVVGFLDQFFEAGRKVRRGDEFVLHEKTPKCKQGKTERPRNVSVAAKRL